MKARNNPFSSRNVEALTFRHAYIRFHEIMHRLKNMSYRASIIGPKGSGKTTLIEQIGKELAGEGFHIKHLCLTIEKSKLSRSFLRNFYADLSPNDAILLDGAEQMPWLQWIFFNLKTKKAGALIITSHIPGLLPELLHTSTSPDLLHGLVFELLGKDAMISRSYLENLFFSHNGNIRLVLRDLYDTWSERAV